MMKMQMNKRVYGVIGIKAVMANWNADFTGNPKTTGNGEIFGSDKALKFPMKKLWERQGEKVIYTRSYTINEKEQKMIPRALKERYQQLFEEKVDAKTPTREVLKNLFSAVDVMNFGATFAEEGQNIGITGAVQFGQGFNKFMGASVEVQDILSPFRNPNGKDGEDRQQASIGKKIVCDEAHYFYPFSVNPQNYDDYKGIAEGFEGYTLEAYEKFKEAALVAATAYNTNSKFGCENEFALFVELKEGEKLYLPDLAQYVEFYRADGKGIIDLSKMGVLCTDRVKAAIEKIELYYNPYTTEVKSDFSATKMNLFTKEVIA